MPFFMPLVILATSATQTVPTAVTSVESKQKVSAAIGQILQAEGAAARSTLMALPEEELEAKDLNFRRCALNRLSLSAPSSEAGEKLTPIDPFAQDVLKLYRTYWRTSAVSKSDRSTAEKVLFVGLARRLGISMPKNDDMAKTKISIQVEAHLKTRGLFSQAGKTGVLYDMMIWSRETEKVEEAALPEGSNATRVHYLDNFLSLGWSSYLACERVGTGGWATEKGLYVIVPSYDNLVNEDFKVNFLAHESQHYSDKKRFGDLPSWRLEFRAKLVELAYADTTRILVLDNFSSNQGEDPNDAHSYANKKVLAALTGRLRIKAYSDLQLLPVSVLQRAAVDELKADTLALSR
jgi:hypothetical protein